MVSIPYASVINENNVLKYVSTVSSVLAAVECVCKTSVLIVELL